MCTYSICLGVPTTSASRLDAKRCSIMPVNIANATFLIGRNLKKICINTFKLPRLDEASNTVTHWSK